ncbi:MAG: hypothetical protein ACFFEF_08425 [Candidatus Thorarchaeota archaeon]
MKKNEKLLVAVLGILIFVFVGANMCTYYSTGAIDWIFATILGGLVFVTAGVITCSHYNGKLAKVDST